MKKFLKSLMAILLVVSLIFSISACIGRGANNFGKQKTISPFEITAKQREVAKSNTDGYAELDAGRGNPNWINSKARLAFARLMQYAVYESRLVINHGDIAGQASLDGIGGRFEKFMNPKDKIDKFLVDAVEYCVKTFEEITKDEIVKEFVDGIIGDYYPTPDRCLNVTEKILNKYLEKTIYGGENVEGNTKIFPTEGGSAAMVYLFQSLNHNRVLKAGDKIAIATPIFTPYLEIPNVNQYGLVSLNLETDAQNEWNIPDTEIEKLYDKEIKAFFLVNPANPASHALSKESLDKIKKACEVNNDLIIITDDVYGTFVNGFKTLYSVVPYNTILVYSFSKLYGVTGWRVGLVAMNEKNVVDKLISELPDDDKEFLRSEYEIVLKEVDTFPFIERLTADSRSISLYHTSGLSTPQQIFMDILSLTHLVNENNDAFIDDINKLVSARYEAMMNAIGLAPDENIDNAKYYVLINILDVTNELYGKDFSDWIKNKYTDLDILNRMAEEKGVVLMYGPGFDAPAYTYRVSLANLDIDDYVEIGRRLKELIDEYYTEYNKE